MFPNSLSQKFKILLSVLWALVYKRHFSDLSLSLAWEKKTSETSFSNWRNLIFSGFLFWGCKAVWYPLQCVVFCILQLYHLRKEKSNNEGSSRTASDIAKKQKSSILMKTYKNVAQGKYSEKQLFGGKERCCRNCLVWTPSGILGIKFPSLAQQGRIMCFVQASLSVQFTPAPTLQ